MADHERMGRNMSKIYINGMCNLYKCRAACANIRLTIQITEVSSAVTANGIKHCLVYWHSILYVYKYSRCFYRDLVLPHQSFLQSRWAMSWRLTAVTFSV